MLRVCFVLDEGAHEGDVWVMNEDTSATVPLVSAGSSQLGDSAVVTCR